MSHVSSCYELMVKLRLIQPHETMYPSCQQDTAQADSGSINGVSSVIMTWLRFSDQIESKSLCSNCL